MRSIDLVREFHERFGQIVASDANINDRGLNELRIKLLAEELEELAEALGFKLDVQWHPVDVPPCAVGTLDALTDLQYVLDGAFLSLGFAHVKDAAVAEVHRSNLTKLGDDGKPVYRADGKIGKPPGWSPPDLRRVLEGE
jgi:hypothetical protein